MTPELWTLAVICFLAAVGGHFVAYLSSVAFRFILGVVMPRILAARNAKAARVTRSCKCGRRFNIFDMKAHLLEAHHEWERDQMLEVMEAFKK